MWRSGQRLWRNADGAVAPTVALSLVALIATGGIAFDYARMASLDTELQNAADQAALAAASQLDGEDGACARAAAAASGMVANQTLMANESGGTRAINVPVESTCDDTGSVRFYQDIAKTQAATSDADAKYVEVEVDPREAFFALTPIVAASRSGQLTAIAFAGLDSAICKVPPLMLCNPDESTDPDFTIANYIGKGIRLVANDGGGIYGPGNFGFLDTGTGNGAQTLRQLLGANNVPGDCVSGDGVETETGSIITVRAALNTRFGIYDNGSLNNACGNDGSGCPPSANIRNDLLLDGSGNAFNKLGFITGGGGNGWRESTKAYPGTSDVGTNNVSSAGAFHILSDSEISRIAPMGYPEDMCHAFGPGNIGNCADGKVGDGNWDRYAYFRSNSVNYPTVTSVAAMNSFLAANMPAGTTTPTRYQVYQWEMANAATRLQSQASAPLTAVPNPSLLSGEPGGVTPGANQVDRRVLAVAVVNCAAEGVGGHTTDIHVQKWIDIFLVQPAVKRTIGMLTENGDIYVEIAGLTQSATNGGSVQLVKKSVPYLIE
jgi:Flp pilus assembly protein TadG